MRHYCRPGCAASPSCAYRWSAWSAGSPSSTSGRTRSGSSCSRTPTSGGSAPTRSTSRCAWASTRRTGGPLQPEPMERALETIELFAHFCRATGIERVRPLATSAIREASNREEFLRAAQKRSGLDVEVLSREEEAHYGYLAAVNSTTLSDGVALDIGGGSMQLTQVADRRAARRAVVAARRGRHDRALPPHRARQAQAAQGAARARARRAALRAVAADAPRRGSPGSAARSATSPRRAMLEEGLPSYGVQGFALRREALDALVERLAELTPAERRARARASSPSARDLILAGAVVVQTVMEVGGFDAMEVTEAGLREGVFFEELLAGRTSRCWPTCARRPCATSPRSTTPRPRTPSTSRGSRWRSGTRSPTPALHAGRADERELLWAAAILHDVGTAVDYDDHHKHSRYLILNAGLPGFSPRETALIGQAARYHRKGQPGHARVRAARAQGRRGAARPLRRDAAASPSSSSARATRRSATPTSRVDDGTRRAAAGEQGRRRPSAAGAPSARPTCSAAPSERSCGSAIRRGATEAGASAGRPADAPDPHRRRVTARTA